MKPLGDSDMGREQNRRRDEFADELCREGLDRGDR